MKIKDFIPPQPIHPGAYIKDQLELLDWSVADLSKHTGISKSTLYAIINEKKDITPEIAQRIEKVLGFKVETLLKLQAKYHRDKEIINIRKQVDNSTLTPQRKRKILSSVLNLFGLA